MAKNSYTSNPLDFAENRSHKPTASVLGIFFHLNTTEKGYKYYIVCTVFVSIKQDKKRTLQVPGVHCNCHLT